MVKQIAVIIGAGPAGLTAAYELLETTDIKPVIYEQSGLVGGISKTIDYKGNKIDIGGHRFFTKSPRVLEWWLKFFPLEKNSNAYLNSIKKDLKIYKPNMGRNDTKKADRVMLIRNRLSRILFMGKLFDYPISINLSTIKNLGFIRTLKIISSYLQIRISPIAHEKSLEDFFINRFGEELYSIFFKDYTEKVWGVRCNDIKPEWGSQRVKGVSISKTILESLGNKFHTNSKTETSLIRSFMYPKWGPGQFWGEIAKTIEDKGAHIRLNNRAIGFKIKRNKIEAIRVRNELDGQIKEIKADYFISSMPVQDLVRSISDHSPTEVLEIADGLIYRDFITVGILASQLKIDRIPDNWIYIQENHVKMGRIQIFNNWSPYLVHDPQTVWLGIEYFCNEGDDLWEMADKDLIRMAIQELDVLNIIDPDKILDGVVIRMEKAYPAYFGSYDKFDVIKQFLDKYGNLFLIGRNGMHRYNNMDHSMLTAMEAVKNIREGKKSKENIWKVNSEEDYHENM
jgi:protoporphyrinogen oxidase